MWGGLLEEFKHHLVEWDKVCTPLAYEGVGDSKTYHFQSIFVVEVAMEVWVGGKQIVETGCYRSRHSWLWVLEEH